MHTLHPLRRPIAPAGWLTALAALAVCVGLTNPHPVAAQAEPGGAQQAGAYEEGFFELYVRGLASRITVTTLVDARGSVLIPVRPIAEYVGIPMKNDGRRLALEWPPSVWSTVLDRDAHTLAVGEETDTIPPAEWVERDGEIYVSSQVLGRILASRVDVDWADLTIVLSETAEFPATRRLELEARRARERLAANRFPLEQPGLPFTPRTGAGTGTWGLTLAGSDGLYRGSFRAAVGGSLWGGAAEMGGSLGFGDHVGRSFSDGYARYSRVFPNGKLVRQLQLGSVLSDGPVARRIAGFTLTNEPYTLPRFFAEALIEPTVPAGWEYEVYQGDQLVGVSAAGQPGDLRAPLNYGNTPVRVRMIGPAGQERVEELLYVVPPTRLPEGQWRYSLGGGPCQDPSCDNYTFGQLRHGFTSWMTGGLGVDRLDPTEGSAKTRLFADLGVTPLRPLSVDMQVQPGSFFQTNASWSTLDEGVFGASYAWTRPTGDAPTLDGWFGQLNAGVPVNVLGGRTVSGRLLLRGAERTSTDSWQAELSTSLRRSYVSLDFESGLQLRRVLTAHAFTPLGSKYSRYVQDLATSVALGATSRGPELLEMGVSFRPVETGSVSLDLRVRRGSAPLLSIGFVTRRREGYFQARAAQGSGAGVFLSGDGGVAWDPEVGVVPLAFQSVGRSGVRGRVFYDRDASGTWTDGDQPAGGVTVQVLGNRVTTAPDGTYQVWEIRPYEVTRVAVDSLSIDPSWVPTPREVLLRPSPNLFNGVDLPLGRTREVTGSVELGGEHPHPLAGVAVEVHAPDGTLVASERTFSDGVFYFQRIPPGRYTITVGRASLDALGVPPGAAIEVVVPAGDDAPVELVPIRIEPGGGS